MTTDPLVSALRAALPDALRARDAEATSALRTALAAVANAEAVASDPAAPSAAREGSQHVAGAALGVGAAEVGRRELSAAEVRAIVEAEVRERVEAADVHEGVGQSAYAGRLRREAEVLRRVLDATAP